MKLNPTQEKILDVLKNRESSYTLEELASELDLSSSSSVHYNLKELVKKGYLKVNPSNSSDYIVLDKLDQGLIYLPMFEGAAKCGPDGNILEDYLTEQIPVPSKYFNFDVSNGLAIKTYNDSMEPQIPRDSIVLINKKESQYQANKTFLVSFNDQALIKNLYQDKENKSYILSSFNRAYRPFIAQPNEINIIGKIKAIISNTDI